MVAVRRSIPRDVSGIRGAQREISFQPCFLAVLHAPISQFSREIPGEFCNSLLGRKLRTVNVCVCKRNPDFLEPRRFLRRRFTLVECVNIENLNIENILEYS